MKKIERIYIGVAWPYVNNLFHIGHLAGALLPPDAFKKYHQLKGNEVVMVSGSDCHGTPITIEAEKEGKKPIEIAKKFHKLNKIYFKKFGIDFTIYTSTHTKNHFEFVQKFFLRILKKGYIKILKTTQLYSPKSKKFLQDRYVEGECPYCHFKEARGDQCENCGRVFEATELINPISKIDRSSLVKKEVENYFFDLPKLETKIKEWAEKKEFRDWVKAETLSQLKEGLKERAITRDLKWGVPLPYSKIPKKFKIENLREKVFYVWFEATLGYISALMEYSKKIGKKNYWKKFFYQKEAKTFYFVGQDNLHFHTIFLPAQLLAFDKKINLPQNVFVQKFLLLEGQKMSKSRGWFLDTEKLTKFFSPESIRFYLLLNSPQEKELNFTFQDFIETNNNILVAKIGNLFHRVLVFASKNFGKNFEIKKEQLIEEVKEKIEKTFNQGSTFFEKGDIKEAGKEILNLVDFGNFFIDKEKIWEKKEKRVVESLIFLIFCLSILLYPFLPNSMKELQKILGLKKIEPRIGKNYWVLPEKIKIKLSSKISPLFSKIDKKIISDFYVG